MKLDVSHSVSPVSQVVSTKAFVDCILNKEIQQFIFQKRFDFFPNSTIPAA